MQELEPYGAATSHIIGCLNFIRTLYQRCFSQNFWCYNVKIKNEIDFIIFIFFLLKDPDADTDSESGS
jgi:hypothetical protein